MKNTLKLTSFLLIVTLLILTGCGDSNQPTIDKVPSVAETPTVEPVKSLPNVPVKISGASNRELQDLSNIAAQSYEKLKNSFCIDSDDEDKYVFGNVTIDGYLFQDSCKSANDLYEFVCINGKPQVTVIACEKGCNVTQCFPKEYRKIHYFDMTLNEPITTTVNNKKVILEIQGANTNKGLVILAINDQQESVTNKSWISAQGLQFMLENMTYTDTSVQTYVLVR